MPISNVDYRPKARIRVKANHAIYLDIAHLTGIPLAKVLTHGRNILQNAMTSTVQQIDDEIDKYMPKATGQIRNSLKHQLHQSAVGNTALNMNFGTYVKYMKYIANMPSRSLRHPKHIKQKYSIYQRNSKHGKKGQPKRNPGQWRYVKYYGPARWVHLDDPKAQTNFWSSTLVRMKTYLQKAIASEIKSAIPASQRKPFYNKLKVKKL